MHNSKSEHAEVRIEKLDRSNVHNSLCSLIEECSETTGFPVKALIPLCSATHTARCHFVLPI